MPAEKRTNGFRFQSKSAFLTYPQSGDLTREQVVEGVTAAVAVRSSLLVNKDLVKLSNFQAGALDELVKKYGNKIGLTSLLRSNYTKMDTPHSWIFPVL